VAFDQISSQGQSRIKMASEQAAPPVPYTRLKEITESVGLLPFIMAGTRD